MKRSYLVAGGVALAVGAWLATGFLDRESPGVAVSQTAPTRPEAAMPAVQVVERRAEPHSRTIVVFGRSEADRRVDVQAETDGRVAYILVRKGQRVATGEALVRLAMDDREARLRQAQAEVKQREVAYNASRRLRSEGFSPEIKMTEDLARLEEARARLAAVELDIDRTTIEAPFAGIVDAVPVEVGDYVTGGGMDGSSVVATVVDLEPLVVVASVTERDRPVVEVGAAADIRLPTGQTVAGEVSYVTSIANAETRTFAVEIEAPNPDGRVPEGVTAEVLLHTGEVTAHRLTPSVLTLNDEGALGVKTVGEDGRVDFHRVAIVDDTPEGMWLTGLPDETRIIVVGQEFVREDQRVQPVPAGASTPTDAPAARANVAGVAKPGEAQP